MQISMNGSWAPRLGVLLLVAGALSLAGCEQKKSVDSAQVAATVNKQEITLPQVNLVLQQQRGLRPEQLEAASAQALERLIDQELAVQKATELKLDREPRVQLLLEAARREVLARAYLDKADEAAAIPGADEVAKYYEANPALFKERRIYNLQEFAIEASPEQVVQLRTKMAATKNGAELIEYLKANDMRFSGNQAVRAAEQLPLPSLGTIAAMKDGEAVLMPTPNGALVVVLAGSRSQPIALDKATPAIEQFLLNARKRELIASDLKALRAGASIAYAGKFAEAAASAPAGGSASAAAASFAPAASEAADAASHAKDGGLK
ncbi:MAG TPA: EpsD family peptidyl-prolyl cis-trans isomerase [Rubrivivax sp.]|nr:EpsD family peptidyl-prolyl cis-trans isomerase [Rubrivivax sp.]